MSVDQVTSSAGINAILNGQSQAVEEEEEDPLGRDAFLTMLVAQLQHQDPLNPLDGTDFSAQLAQFSTLEQMFNVNDNLENIEAALGTDTEGNLLDLIGKEVTTGNDTLNVSGGSVSGGTYTIDETANIILSVYDSTGARAATIPAGRKEAGTYSVEWNGTDDYGDMVTDGSYSFEVMAVDDNYEQVPVETTLSGTVTGVTYEYGTAYLLMGDNLVDPSNIIRVNQGT